MTDFAHRVLLVDLDKDYISNIERKNERDILKLNSTDIPEMGFNLFTQALHNLKIDIELWKATSGISMMLDVKNDLIHDYNYKDIAVNRTHTQVYGIFHNANDVAWFKLQLGDLKPSTKLVHYPSRGWQFEWA